jgi:molecular chaperone DnaK
VTPLTLGLETLGSVSHALIPRNTTIPTSKSEVFTTAENNQTSVEIHVLQGERPMVADNKSIGRFILDGILPAPRGLPKVEVTFDIDANGILSVSAKDQATGREQKIIIQPSSGLSTEEIDQLVKDAAEHAEEDRVRREEADVRNTADQISHGAEKLLEEQAEHIPEDLKQEIQEKVEALRQVAREGDIATVRSRTADLNAAVQKVGAHVYQQAGPAGPGDGPGGPPGPEDDEGPGPDTVEGEFREV